MPTRISAASTRPTCCSHLLVFYAGAGVAGKLVSASAGADMEVSTEDAAAWGGDDLDLGLDGDGVFAVVVIVTAGFSTCVCLLWCS